MDSEIGKILVLNYVKERASEVGMLAKFQGTAV